MTGEIKTYEEPVEVGHLHGVWRYTEVHVDWEDRDTIEEIKRLQKEGELDGSSIDDIDEEDVLKYLRLS